MNAGQIYYAVAGNRAFLKLVGAIRYPLSQRLSMAVGRMFARTKVRGVVVDLQEAEFIDSTCMGLLARVATRCLDLACDRRSGSRRSTTRSRLTRHLRSGSD